MIEDAESLYDDDSENEAYNESIRELQGGFREYGPIMNRVVSCFYLFSTDGWMRSTLDLVVTHFITLQSSELNKAFFMPLMLLVLSPVLELVRTS